MTKIVDNIIELTEKPKDSRISWFSKVLTMRRKVIPVEQSPGYPEQVARVAYHYAERKIGRTLKTIGAVGLVAVGALVGFEIGHGSSGSLGSGFGSTKPKAEAAVKPEITTEATQQISCNANIYFNVGAKASAREYYISGFSSDTVYPFKANFCNNGQGLGADTFVTRTAAGEVKEVKVDLPHYFAVNPAMNFNKAAVYCSGLSSDASEKQIKQAVQAWDNAVSHNKTVDCKLNDRATGLGIASDGTAAGVIYANQLAAQNAADMYWFNETQVNGMLDAIKQSAITEDVKKYHVSPGMVEVVTPPYVSPLNQLKIDWNNNGKTIDQAMKEVKFSDVGDKTTVLEETTYWGVDVTVDVPYIPPKQVEEINNYIASNTTRP